MKQDENELTQGEAAILLRILRQAGPSIRMDVDNPEASLREAQRLQTMLLKLKRLAGEGGNVVSDNRKEP